MANLQPEMNDLKNTHPDLCKEWHPTKNGTLLPEQVSAGSHKKVWWLCRNGHEWESTIKNRAKAGRGCPYCSNQKILRGYNDLETKNPHLAEEWDYKKNLLTPGEVSPSSSKKYWWICRKYPNHSWNATINHRTRPNSGCPYCSGKKVLVGFNDLTTVNPELAQQWDYDRNERGPECYSAGSNEAVYWKCKDYPEHNWLARINSRNRGNGCPFCSNQKVWEGFNDLQTCFPDLALEWDLEKNNIKPNQVTKYSSKVYYWKCSVGHSWKATITNRSQGRGCPECDKRNKTSFPQEAIRYYCKNIYPDTIGRYKDIFDNGMEIDVYIPSIKIGIEYDGPYHSGKDSLNRDSKKYDICKKQGIKLIRVKTNPQKSDEKLCDFLIESKYDSQNFEAIDEYLKKLFDYLHVNCDVNTGKDEKRIKKEYLTTIMDISLERQYPELAKEWNYERNQGLLPSMFSPGSGEKVWWRCKNNPKHEWQAQICSRVAGRGCKFCANQAIYKGENDLESLFPEIAKEWHPYKNDGVRPSDVTANTRAKYVWICPQGHEYKASVATRTRGGGCKYCKRIAISEARSKTVAQYSKDGKLVREFKSITEASLATGNSKEAISHACTGQTKSSGGYIWKHLE